MRLAMEPVCPQEKGRPLEFQLPPIRKLDLLPATIAILQAVGDGVLPRGYRNTWGHAGAA